MVDIYPPARQRPALLASIEALDARPNCLRRDECGDWQVVGKLGHIYAVPGTLARRDAEGFQLYFRGAARDEEPSDTKAWTWAKKALGFCKITNDGDGEGMLFLDRLPNPEEAVTIREKFGIPKKREVSPETLELLARHSFQKSPRAGDEYSPPEPVPDASPDGGSANQPPDAGSPEIKRFQEIASPLSYNLKLWW